MNKVTDEVTNAVKSRTTMTITGSAGGSAFSLAGLFVFVRSNWPDLLPWLPESDPFVVATLTTILTPIVSRMIAKYRGKV